MLSAFLVDAVITRFASFVESYMCMFWASLGIIGIGIIYMIWGGFSPERRRSDRMPLIARCVITVFFALVFLYYPVYRSTYTHGEVINSLFWVRPLLLSVHNALRTFILDGDVDAIMDAVAFGKEAIPDWLHYCYTGYSLLLYIIAPILTFSSILSYFSNFTGWMKLSLKWGHPIYIMSVLNTNSVILASDIQKSHNRIRHKPVIVYAGVDRQKEINEDLLAETRVQHALLLRTTVDNIPLRVLHKRHIEIFMIDGEEKENDNIKRTLRIVSALEKRTSKELERRKQCEKRIKNIFACLSKIKHREKNICYSKKNNRAGEIEIASLQTIETVQPVVVTEQRGEEAKPDKERTVRKLRVNTDVKVFAFARSLSSGLILDSLSYPRLLESAEEKDFKEDETFKLRRVDIVRQLAWNIVPGMVDKNEFLRDNGRESTLSFLIIGVGQHGLEFLKTILWFYQHLDYRLEINLVSLEKKTEIEGRIGHDCPELLTMNPCQKEDGEGNYDIQIFGEIDARTDALCKLMEPYGDKDAEGRRAALRLKRTNVVLVALGSDDLNIETAIQLRSAFDRLHGICAKDIPKSSKKEKVKIYSVVYDGDKVENLSIGGTDSQDDGKAAKEAKSSNKVEGQSTRGADSQNEGNAVKGPQKGLHNHKGQEYHIEFIGSDQYSYSYRNVYDPVIERMGIIEHIKWSIYNGCIYDLLNKESHEQIKGFVERKWNEENDKSGNVKKKKETGNSTTSYEYDTMLMQLKERYNVNGERAPQSDYEQYEYFRLSSISSAMMWEDRSKYQTIGGWEDELKDVKERVEKLSKKVIEGTKPDNEDSVNESVHENMNSKKEHMIEHMRWNVYMRVNGYMSVRYHARPVRADRAKVHNNLHAYDKLDDTEKTKDAL